MVIEITRMKEEHLHDVTGLEFRSFSEPWSYEAFKEALCSDEYVYLTALHEGKVVGYAGAVIAVDEGSITNIAVDEDYRRYGIASELMSQIGKCLKDRAVTQVFLEVRESNYAAIKLYEGCGYYEVGVRKNFYRKPDENGIVMRLDLD